MSRINQIRPIITAPTGYANANNKTTEPAFKGLPKFSGGLGIQPEVFDYAGNRKAASDKSATTNKNRLNFWA